MLDRAPGLVLLLIAGLLASGVAPALAQEGRDVALRVQNRADGDDSYAEASLDVYEGGEQTRSRTAIMARKESGDLERLYIRFTAPPSIEDTAFLTRENESGRSDQYLYMPELRRARRIDMGQRDKRFVGTDFTYEDLEARKVDEYTHELVGETTCGPDDARTCWIVTSTPKPDVASQYAWLKRWIAQDAEVDVRVDHYNADSTVVKRLTVTDLKRVDGIWTAMRSRMEDRVDDRWTILKLDTIEYDRGLPSRMFTPSFLRQADS